MVALKRISFKRKKPKGSMFQGSYKAKGSSTNLKEKYFQELVNYYKVHNLCESFNSLNTVLKNPYRDCKVFRVIHDFEQDEQKFLSIKTGDILTLVDTVGEDRGWWKGSINNRVNTVFFVLNSSPLTLICFLCDACQRRPGGFAKT